MEPLRTMEMWSEECLERFRNLVGQKLISAVVTGALHISGNPEFNIMGEKLGDMFSIMGKCY